MNDTFLKQTAEFRSALASQIANQAVAELIVKTKASSDSDSGTFKVIVSTEDFDRQGESVKQDGWDLSYFKANPVVLWAHDYSSLPIGVCTSIEVEMGKLIATGKFAPEDANPFAQQVRRLYDLGMVRATSVGFIPKEFDGMSDGVITRSELLEFSFVPVPANPHALSLSQIKELKIDTALLKTKGIEIAAAKEPVAGDACTTADGSAGTLTADADGKLVCTIKAIEEVKELDHTENIKIIKELLIKIYEKITTKDVALGAGDPAADGNKAGEKETPPVNGSKSSQAPNDLNEFIEQRTLLRSIDNCVEILLRSYNQKAREKGISIK